MAYRKAFARATFLVAGVLLALISGCILDSSDDHDDPESQPLEYRTPDSPEDALYNIYVALRTRDLEGYDGVLASDFAFLFSPDESPETMGSCDGEWSREEEMSAIGAMFASSQVTDIDLDLPEVEAVPSTEIGTPEDAMRIRLAHVHFEVDEVDGMTFWTRDSVIHDLFFRPGRSDAGEDPASWYLFLWRETPPVSAPGLRTLSGPTPVRATYWWAVKCRWAE